MAMTSWVFSGFPKTGERASSPMGTTTECVDRQVRTSDVITVICGNEARTTPYELRSWGDYFRADQA